MIFVFDVRSKRSKYRLSLKVLKCFYRLLLDKDGVVFEADHVLVRGCLDRIWEARIDQALAPVRALYLLLCSNYPLKYIIVFY